MKICGFNKSSEAGPDIFAPSIFLGGCNLRCPYCMNSRLIFECDKMDNIPLSTIEGFVRENNCKWINISGGEPTCSGRGELYCLIAEMKKWGCKVAMSTNGTNPCELEAIFPMLDYVTIDFKTSVNRYIEVGCSDGNNLLCSLMFLNYKKYCNRMFDFEIRTTLYPNLVGKDEINDIGCMIGLAKRWVLQPFRKTKTMLSEEAYTVKPYSIEEMESLVVIARCYCKNVVLSHV